MSHAINDYEHVQRFYCSSVKVKLPLCFQKCSSSCDVNEARQLGSQEGRWTWTLVWPPVLFARLCLQKAHKSITGAWLAPLFSHLSLIRCGTWICAVVDFVGRLIFFSSSNFTVHGRRAVRKGTWNSWTWKNRKRSGHQNAVIWHEGK